MREDFETRGIRFAYLDGSSKNRLEIVKQFNEDRNDPCLPRLAQSGRNRTKSRRRRHGDPLRHVVEPRC